MTIQKQKKAVLSRRSPNQQGRVYFDADDRYFRKHFAQLVREHGGEWIILAEGKLVGIGKRGKIPAPVRKAKSNHPDATPFIAPIPTQEELECVL